MIALLIGMALVGAGGLVNLQSVKAGTSKVDNKAILSELRGSPAPGSTFDEKSERVAMVNQAIARIVAPWLWKIGIVFVGIGLLSASL